MSTVSLTATADGERLALVAAGTWTADRAAELERIIDEMRVVQKLKMEKGT